MEQNSIAMQRAMAAEIRSRLGYMNRSQAWLQKEAGVPSATWRKYFTEGAITRDVPLHVVQRIATSLGLLTSELIDIAETHAPEFAVDDMKGITDAERDELHDAVTRTQAPKKKSPGRNLRGRQTGT